MKLPLKKDDLATSITIRIDSAIPLLKKNRYTHTGMKSHHCSVLCESKALKRKKNVPPQETSEANYGTPIHPVKCCEAIKMNEAALGELIQKDL